VVSPFGIDATVLLRSGGEEEDDEPAARESGLSSGRRSTGGAPEVAQGPVHIKVEEKITLEATRDGGLENMEVKGIIFAAVNDPTYSKIKINTSTSGDKGTVLVVFWTGCWEFGMVLNATPARLKPHV
jgi:hypothetical protein